MREHINAEGRFQSDKYPTCPAGKVPLSTRDKFAQDLLWEYAQRRRKIDKEFSDDLETCLKADGYVPNSEKATLTRSEALQMLRNLQAQIISPKDNTWKRMADAFSQDPEGCILVAFHTGDGWALTVEDPEGNTIAYLAWPENWPEIMNNDQLREAGFRID